MGLRSEQKPTRGLQYEALMPLLEAMFREFQELSKKKPDAVLNKKKVEIVNRLLREVRTILEGEPQDPFLDLLNEEDLPGLHPVPKTPS